LQEAVRLRQAEREIERGMLAVGAKPRDTAAQLERLVKSGAKNQNIGRQKQAR
jgi:hypothetical protein